MADVSGEVGTPMFSREDRGNDFRPLQVVESSTKQKKLKHKNQNIISIPNS
jgi:hypothetical protein